MHIKTLALELQRLADKQGNNNQVYGDKQEEISIFGELAQKKTF